jgi:surface antigen
MRLESAAGEATMEKTCLRMSATAAAFIAAGLAGCADQGYGPKQSLGTLGGAALGGLLGAQFGSGTGQIAATAAGVLIGALTGSEVGLSLDRADRAYANQAIYRAQAGPMGETIFWQNPASGNRGAVTPVRDGTSARGDYCREFQQSITVGGQTRQGYGIACRQPDGSWRIVNTDY